MQPGMTPTVRAEVTSATHDPAEAALIDAVFVELQQRIGEKRFGVWFDGKVRLSITDDRLTVAVGSPFLLNWMQKQFHDELTGAAQALLGPSAQAAFTVDASLAVSRGIPFEAPPSTSGEATTKSGSDSTKASTALTKATQSAGNPSATLIVPTQSVVAGSVSQVFPGRSRKFAELSDFVSGPQTELALTAARQLASGMQVPFNPLYLCGPVGSGKTHLLEGICRQLKRSQPAFNVVLITAEAFANYFITRLSTKVSRCRRIDC